MQQWIYGVGYPKGNEHIFIDRYRKHNSDVADYFRDRPRDLLVLDIEGGELWRPICEFLSLDVPNTEFSHANRGAPVGSLSAGRKIAVCECSEDWD